jgi:hypothetical protein
MATNGRLYKDQLISLQYDPTAIQRIGLDLLDNEIVDPTNPFVMLMECAACGVSAAMEKDEVLTRKQYPYSAQTPEDLYPHMSDKDFIGRFATPAKAVFQLFMGKNELLNRLVHDPLTKTDKLVIPRNTYFTVADTVFSLQYPIEIRRLLHGEIQVVYDVENPSPLQELETNLVKWGWFTKPNGEEVMRMYFDTYQFNIISEQGSVNLAVDFATVVDIKDNFYYARVYYGTVAGGWVEMKTTHTDQIYDPMKPTAVLQVIEKAVNVRIPQIYVTQGLVTGMIRVDVYETKGPLNMYLSEYNLTDFVGTFMAYDKTDYTPYVAPLKAFRELWPLSESAVVGGSLALPFPELRDKVLNNSVGPSSKPITTNQLSAAVKDDGFGFAVNVDNITDRALLATRAMPTPTDVKLITAAAATIETVITTIEQAVAMGNVIDNGTAITLTPKTLYENVGGITSMVDAGRINTLLEMPPDHRAVAVSDANYLYTPFHYVLDWSRDEFDLRAYYLDNPEAITKTFKADNDTTLLMCSTDSYDIIQTPTGYMVRIVTASNEAFRELDNDQVHVQLAFIPAGEKDRAYLNGVFAGFTESGERAYTFDVGSNMNVDSEGNLGLTKFFLYSTEPRITGAGLEMDFDILYSTSAVMDVQWRPNIVDSALGLFLLPARIAGVGYEVLRIRFGYALKTLWASARSVAGSATYKTWDMDIQAFYEEDILAVDENGSSVIILPNGTPSVTYLHHKGDPVLEDGEIVYLHRKGDIVLEDGQPVLIGERVMDRHIDIFLIEGAYWFATDPSALNYRDTMTKTVVGWLTDDLANRGKQLLEQTRLYFHPETTLGVVSAVVGDGIIRNVNAGQALTVELAVTEEVKKDAVLCKRLEDVTITTISAAFEESTISISKMQEDLRTVYAGSVLDVRVTGLGGDANYSIITIIDPTQRCSIRKQLTVLGDNGLIVKEDINVRIIPHKSVS